jgi:hypothetical protein
VLQDLLVAAHLWPFEQQDLIGHGVITHRPDRERNADGFDVVVDEFRRLV